MAVTGIFVYAVEEIGLFVIVRRQDDVVDDSLQDLQLLASSWKEVKLFNLRNEASGGPLPQLLCQEPAYNACRHQGICHHASPK